MLSSHSHHLLLTYETCTLELYLICSSIDCQVAIIGEGDVVLFPLLSVELGDELFKYLAFVVLGSIYQLPEHFHAAQERSSLRHQQSLCSSVWLEAEAVAVSSARLIQLENVREQSINSDACKGSGLKVVFTPLNGAGNKLVRKILDRIGIDDVVVVPEQEMPDGNFTTCPYPNPEIKEALALGLELSKKVDADLLLATDPDSDRVGIAVKVNGGYRLMSGNETGIMLMNYILSCRKENGTLPENPVAVKTIVTSKLVEKICEKYGCELKNVLTGFKYIGEQILLLERKNEEKRYIFGFEESYGYLAGTYVRDKDAVVASMLICEMAAYYRQQGKSLDEVMTSIYDEFGYYLNRTESYEFEGSAGMQKMSDIMTNLRNAHPAKISAFKVTAYADYLNSYSKDTVTGETSEITLPKSNVLSYSLEDGGAVIVRPSGTEPKIKVYVTAVGKSQQDASAIADDMFRSMTSILGI